VQPVVAEVPDREKLANGASRGYSPRTDCPRWPASQPASQPAVAVGQFAEEQALHRSLVGDHAADVEAEQLVLPFLGGPAGQDVCDRVGECGAALPA
jgi:hypothetical protein